MAPPPTAISTCAVFKYCNEKALIAMRKVGEERSITGCGRGVLVMFWNLPPMAQLHDSDFAHSWLRIQ
jgi:hypothetical protein